MADLVLRPSSHYPDKPFALQLRHHGPVETEYRTLCRVNRSTADEIINAGGAFWLLGEPKEASNDHD
ncbi:hypothetical protein [Phyllobacterium leguminum]|uniref:Uncharacterized protein n=1 Tax=Phyllobacterium leguminum TaxID=314237 RepID=A0A318T457_9HYPH|nr:hypothetical protein [Phyllobacterium leguminum]PYE89653.1 hypothetical protein C7477_103161 [Phyllobacterium leguminum]